MAANNKCIIHDFFLHGPPPPREPRILCVRWVREIGHLSTGPKQVCLLGLRRAPLAGVKETKRNTTHFGAFPHFLLFQEGQKDHHPCWRSPPPTFSDPIPDAERLLRERLALRAAGFRRRGCAGLGLLDEALAQALDLPAFGTREKSARHLETRGARRVFLGGRLFNFS